MSEFKPGDVVMLRCGGPMMVVARLDEPRPTPPANAGWGYGDLDPYRPAGAMCSFAGRCRARRDGSATRPRRYGWPMLMRLPRLRQSRGG